VKIQWKIPGLLGTLDFLQETVLLRIPAENGMSHRVPPFASLQVYRKWNRFSTFRMQTTLHGAVFNWRSSFAVSLLLYSSLPCMHFRWIRASCGEVL